MHRMHVQHDVTACEDSRGDSGRQLLVRVIGKVVGRPAWRNIIKTAYLYSGTVTVSLTATGGFRLFCSVLFVCNIEACTNEFACAIGTTIYSTNNN